MPKGKRLEDWTNADFTRLFQIVKFKGKDPETGALKWKGMRKAAREFGVTPPTVYKAAKLAMMRWGGAPPPKAKGMMPKVALEFYESEGWKRVKGHKYEKDIETPMFKAWEILGRFDPYTWTPEMIAKLRNQFVDDKPNPLYIGITNNIAPSHARDLRRAIRAMRSPLKDELIAELKDIPKRPKGSRKHWYLENSEIIRLIKAILSLPLLIFTRLELECGARPISLAGVYKDANLMLTTDKINMKRHSIRRYESKKKNWVYPKFAQSTLEMVQRYIRDMKLPYGAKLLPRNQKYYSEKFKQAGLRAGIAKLQIKGAAAYTMRHTFATQAREHDVPLDHVAFMGGWTDTSTLEQYYVEIKESALDRTILGIVKEKTLSFSDWVKQFEPYWEAQYEVCLKNLHAPKPRARRKPKKAAKTKRKIPFSWELCKKRAESKPKHPKGTTGYAKAQRLIAYWKKVWELHEKHPELTYEEIQKRYLKK